VRKKRIIIADDEAHVRNTIELLLTGAGYEVMVADNGAEALTLLEKNLDEENRIDLVLTDLQMPVMTGVELIEQIVCRNIKCPAIAFTAYGDEDTIIRLINSSGCMGYLEKPFTEQKLITRIEDAINQYEADHQISA